MTRPIAGYPGAARRTWLHAVVRGVAAVTFAASACTLHAQRPRPDSARSTLVGLVRDSTGAPIPDVQVLLFARHTGTYTDAEGWFTLRNVPPGDYAVRFQRLGYRPVDSHWRARAGMRTEIAIVLHTVPYALDTVVVSGRAPHRARGHAVIFGVVVDSAGSPLSDVRLDLLGTGESSATNVDGRFIFPELKPGAYLLRARQLGFAPQTTPVQVVADSRHTLAIRMNALGVLLDPVEIRAKSGFGKHQAAWREFDERQQWRSDATSVTLLREELRPLGKLPLDIALQYTAAMGLRDMPQSLVTAIDPRGISASTTITDDESACILVDGGEPRYEPLRAFYASDLQAVEVYAAKTAGTPESDLTGTVKTLMSSIPACAGSPERHPAYYVVWLKNAP